MVNFVFAANPTTAWESKPPPGTAPAEFDYPALTLGFWCREGSRSGTSAFLITFGSLSRPRGCDDLRAKSDVAGTASICGCVHGVA
jgi:hypothetical protein